MIWRKLYAWTCQSTTALAFSSPRTISRRSPRLRMSAWGVQLRYDDGRLPVPRPTPCDDASQAVRRLEINTAMLDTLRSQAFD